MIECSKCNNPISLLDLNLEQGLPVCNTCKGITPSVELPVKEEDYSHKEDISTPSEFEVQEQDNILKIGIARNRIDSFVKPLLMGIIFIGMAVFGLKSTFEQDGFQFYQLAFVMFLSPGLLPLYQAVVSIFNTTYIETSQDAILLYHRPIKLFGLKDKKYKVSEIKQLYTKRYSSGSSKKNGGSQYLYSVNILLKSGEVKTLINNLKSPVYAFFIERRIEMFLGVKEKRVRDEYHPDQHFGMSAIGAARQVFNTWLNRKGYNI